MSNPIHRVLLAFAAFVLLLPTLVQAQQQESQDQDQNGQVQPETQGQRGAWARRGRNSRGMKMLAKKLNLTGDQKQQFQKIRQQTSAQAKTIRGDSSLSDQQKREKIQQLHKQAHHNMFAVLTPEQKEQLKQMREQHKKTMQQKNEPGDEASG
ncbi:MAG: Spy/CpxP family protein refolding chaperone, partial [Candidatus Angelobacter sp.]